MSFKAFHVFFIVVAALISVLCGVWGVRDYATQPGATSSLVLGIVAFVAGAMIVVYGVWFMRKNKHVSYI